MSVCRCGHPAADHKAITRGGSTMIGCAQCGCCEWRERRRYSPDSAELHVMCPYCSNAVEVDSLQERTYVGLVPVSELRDARWWRKVRIRYLLGKFLVP